MGLFGDDFEQTVKRFEGYAPRASWDYKQHSNGWGTRARYPGEAIDQAEAQRRLDEELSKAHGAVRSFAPNLDAGTTKALTDLTFNAGTKWQTSGLGAAIKAGDLDKARNLYQQYVKAGGETLPGLVERRKVGASWIGTGGIPSTDGQSGMRQPYPWMGLPWPQGEGDVGAQPTGPMITPRGGAQGFFDAAMPAETAPEMQAPPMPPPQGARGPMVAGNVSRETPSEQGPNFIQRLSQDPLFMGGLMMALDGANGGSGITGFTKGAGSASGIQEAYMRNLQLQKKAQQEKALRETLASGQMGDVPRPLLALAQATNDPSLIGQFLARDPLDSQHKRLQNEVLQRNLNAPPDDGSKLIEVGGSIVRVSRDGKATPVYGSDPTTQRRQQLIAAKIDPETPTSKIFIATGKMPREDQQPLTAGDKKAILEADSNVMSTQNVLTLLKEAEELNPKTNTGWTAGIRASIGNNLPDWLVPDAISSKESSKATTNFENLTVGQALSQLKSTFGAAPTEGERKILMDLQGSVNQPVEVRKDILRRAKMMAEKRLSEQQGIADGLRGGTFYKQGGGVKPPTATGPAATTAPAPAAVLSEARAAIQRGAPREAVLQRLRDNGIDPAGL